MEAKFIYLLFIIIISIYLIWKDDKKKKKEKIKDDFELMIVNDSSINIFNIEKKELRILNNVFFINKFKDFVLLSDFNSNTHNFNYETDYLIIRNSYYLIGKDLLFKIISYKGTLQAVVERIKFEYMCWHTGKSIKYNEIEHDNFDIKDINDEIEYNRLEGKIHKKWQNIRKAIIKRDNSICVLCGDELTDKPTDELNDELYDDIYDPRNYERKYDEIHIHHIIYRNDGGNDNYNNLVTLCIDCHATLPKHDKVIEFGYTLPIYYSKDNQNKNIIKNIKDKNIKLHDEIWIDTISSNPLLNILGKELYSNKISDKNLLSEIFLRADPSYRIIQFLKK
jgi:hypothetical protein